MNHFHLQEVVAVVMIIQRAMTNNNNYNKLGMKFIKIIQQFLKKFILNNHHEMHPQKIN